VFLRAGGGSDASDCDKYALLYNCLYFIHPPGLRELLLLDKPVTGWTSSKAALQSEAWPGSKREGLTQGKLDSSMYGSTSPGLQKEVTSKPRMR